MPCIKDDPNISFAVCESPDSTCNNSGAMTTPPRAIFAVALIKLLHDGMRILQLFVKNVLFEFSILSFELLFGCMCISHLRLQYTILGGRLPETHTCGCQLPQLTWPERRWRGRRAAGKAYVEA